MPDCDKCLICQATREDKVKLFRFPPKGEHRRKKWEEALFPIMFLKFFFKFPQKKNGIHKCLNLTRKRKVTVQLIGKKWRERVRGIYSTKNSF